MLVTLFPVAVFFCITFLTGMTFTSSDSIDPDQEYIDITVKDMAGVAMLRPVTGGIPVAEGAAPEGSVFELTDGNNKPVPCQSEVLATWNDGSARWVLLDFQADPEINGTDNYRLTWNTGNKNFKHDKPVRVKKGENLSVNSGKVELKTVSNALLRVSDRFDIKLVLTDRNGDRCEAVAEEKSIETEGALRSTVSLSGSFRNPKGIRVIDFRLRASVYAGLDQFYLEPQIIVNADTGMIT